MAAGQSVPVPVLGQLLVQLVITFNLQLSSEASGLAYLLSFLTSMASFTSSRLCRKGWNQNQTSNNSPTHLVLKYFEGFYFNFILFLSYFKLLMMKICGKLKQLPSAKTNTHRPPTHFLLCSHFLLFLLRLSMGILRVNFGVKKGLQQHSFAFREEPDLVIPLGISEPGLQRQKRQQGDQKRQQGLQC